MEQEILDGVALLVKKALQAQLAVKRPSTTYGGPGKPGVPKPVSGRYPTPISSSNASRRLSNSINVFWETDFEDGQPNLVVELEDYWYFVDQGRRPGRYPPLNVIKQWAQIKPTERYRDSKGRFISNDARAFLMARSIAKYGYGGNSFFDKGLDNIIPTITDDNGPLADAIVAYVERLIDEGRIFPRTTFNTPNQ